MGQTRIFVSHSHEDDDFTRRLVRDLRAAGGSVWVDMANLGAGDFLERINTELASCEYVVLVLTREALASPWVKQEVNAAIRLKHQGRITDILPVQAGPLDPAEIPPLWGVYNIFDTTNDYASALAKIVRVLHLAHSDRQWKGTLTPIRAIDNTPRDPYAPPDPFFLRELYGDQQMRLVLERHSFASLRGAVTIVQKKYPGTAPKKMTKVGIIEYILGTLGIPLG